MTTMQRVRPTLDEPRPFGDADLWWDCPACGVEAELPPALLGCGAACPDCGDGMLTRF